MCHCFTERNDVLFALQRVMMQIVQDLCKRPGLNKIGFDMQTVYIPNPNKVCCMRVMNQQHTQNITRSFLTISFSAKSKEYSTRNLLGI